ncbi:hypothetical protein ACQP00_28295 [Dactylosporangium sp. CS-047395]|uniref:hypothetical protein n=1 Tax=Dactylosporangium sp. CS-047395 TaxID=3239936 RepID=UPI003D8FC533
MRTAERVTSARQGLAQLDGPSMEGVVTGVRTAVDVIAARQGVAELRAQVDGPSVTGEARPAW